MEERTGQGLLGNVERRSSLIVINIDGGSRGNPGPGGWGVVVCRDGEILAEIKGTLTYATNNQAEYHALIGALRWCVEKEIQEDIHIFSDSQLMVRQMQGRFKVNSLELQTLWGSAHGLANTLLRKMPGQSGGSIRFEHVRREQNRHADRLANEAMDTV